MIDGQCCRYRALGAFDGLFTSQGSGTRGSCMCPTAVAEFLTDIQEHLTTGGLVIVRLHVVWPEAAA